MPKFNDWRQRELDRVRRENGDLFDRLCTALGLPADCFAPLRQSGPSVRIIESSEQLLVELSSFVMPAEDLAVLLKNNVLTVEVSAKYSSPQLIHRIPLPCRVHPEGSEATLRKGVLRIVLPKCTQGMQTRIPVKGA